MKAIINRNYTKLITGVFITRFGDSIDSIAFSWLVYVMTGSRVLMGSIFAISILPNIIVLPFGGVIADVFNKKKIAIFGDVLRGISVAALALFYYFNILEVWHLFMFVTLNSLFESFANPAKNSILPSIIDSEDYVKGSSWLGTSSQFGTLIGLSVASVLIALVGIWGTILIDAMTFFISVVIFMTIQFKDRREEVKEKPNFKKYFILIGEGAKYLWTKKILLGFLLLAAYINFAFVPYNVLRPIYVVEVLGLGVEGLSYLGMSMMIGMIVGGYIMGVKGKHLNPVTGVGLGLSLMGIMYMLLGVPGYTTFNLTTNTIYALIVTFLFGGFIPVVNAPIQAVIMKTTAPEMIGRLSSIMGVIALCAMPLGGVFVSIIGDSISVSLLFIIMGISAFSLASLFWMKNRKAVFA